MENKTPLGKRIMNLANQLNNKIYELLYKTESSTIEIHAQLQKWFDEYVSQFVEMGKQKEALSKEEREKVDNDIMQEYFKLDQERHNAIYIKKHEELYETSEDTANLLLKFNIITQYSDFALLKKQNPKEAERLGL
ncbi:hypothetical protein WAF17_19585 [Bernardetia sp. ABR2-2B]|uniref:hypothetical protein n=1 Tax=Bernardetia sp. ABR2-2B TaxID=3127472 RepID=UPI0030D258EE